MNESILSAVKAICHTDHGGSIEYIESKFNIPSGQLSKYLDILMHRGDILSYDMCGSFFRCSV